MDDRAFDQFTMSAAHGSRRTMVQGTLTALLGLTVGGVAVTEARPKKSHKKKKHHQHAKNDPGVVCETDGDCSGGGVCIKKHCRSCESGFVGCEGECLDLSVCPADEKHVSCNNSPGCICTRIADNNNTRFCAVSTTCDTHCGPNNSCPTGQACVMTCCDGPGNAGLRCLPSCG